MKWLKRIVLTAVMLLALGAAAVIWQGYQMYSDALAEKPLTEAVEGEEVAAHTIVEDGVIAVKIPVNIPLSIKSDLITLKYFVHVTLDIPFATDIHVNLPVIVTSRAALEN